MKKLFFLLVLAAGFFLFRFVPTIPKPEKKVYWFIPDGMRAEPNLFNVYQWAKEGKLTTADFAGSGNASLLFWFGVDAICRPRFSNRMA